MEQTAAQQSIGEQFASFVRAGSPRIPRCQDCDRLFFYPRPRCPFCFGERIELIAPTEPWRVRSFCWVMRPQAPEFEVRVPILMIVGDLRGTPAIAEGDGWTIADPPRLRSHVRLVSRGGGGDGSLAVFESWAERP